MSQYYKFATTKQSNTGKTYTAFYIIDTKYIAVQFSITRIYPTYSLSCGNASDIIESLDDANKTEFNNAMELFADLQNNYKSYYEKKTVENIVFQFNDVYSKPKVAMMIESEAIVYTPSNDDVNVISGYAIDQWFDENDIAYSKTYNFIETALKDMIFKNYVDVLNEL